MLAALGFAFAISGCAGQPPLGQTPGTLGPPIPTANPSAAIPGPIPTPTSMTTLDPTTEALQNQSYSRLPTLYQLPGTVIAQGQAPKPTSIYHLKAYRIEQIDLSEPTLFPVPVFERPGAPGHTEYKTVDRFWRVSVDAADRSFIIADSPWLIFANDVLLGMGVGGGHTIMIAVFDHQLLPEGASVAVSFGDSGAREAIPERMRIHYTKIP